MESFKKFASSLQTPNFLPIPQTYSVALIFLISFVLIYIPQLDFIFTLFLLVETLLSLSSKLKSRMLLSNEIKLYTFYFIVLVAFNILNVFFLVVYKIVPIIFTVKFAILMFLSVNMQFLGFIEDLLVSIDCSFLDKTKKNSPTQIKSSFEAAQGIVNKQMKSVGDQEKKKKNVESRKDV
ncbi:hypothetical protein CDIK_0240 [Cucumispora dikerogammari]|nr:hypothetical protein CDIK_0240 [Cucumispora dikerogammari]